MIRVILHSHFLVGATEELEMNFAKEFSKQLHSVLRKIPNDVK